MIYLPNKFERFSAALRNSLEASVLKKGVTPKAIESLRKIYTAEALYTDEELPLNLSEYLNRLLLAVATKFLINGKDFRYSVKISGSYTVNKKLFTAFILTVCQNSDTVEILDIKQRTVIKSKVKKECCEKFLKSLDAVFLYDSKAGMSAIALPLKKTDKEAEYSAKEWDLKDPFSAVNIFIFR